MSFDIKRAWMRLIELYENPLVPIILQDAYRKVDKLGQALASRADRRKTNEYWNKLVSAWPEGEEEDELDTITGEPEFIIALSGMLCESLRAYVRKISDDPE